MIHKYNAKEIHFLKTGSEDQSIHPPETYFSDLIFDPTTTWASFDERLSKLLPDKKAVICAVLQINPKAEEATKESARDTFESSFAAILDKTGENRGIWESIDDTAFALAFWDYEHQKDGIRLLELLKQKISKELKTEILMGMAVHPFHDSPSSETLKNALKAIDHAAFFGPGHMIAFDAISLNICGDRLFHLEKYEQAIEEYQAGLQIDPKNINLNNSLGVCYGIMDQLDKALKYFEKASAINPKEVMVIYNIGLIHRVQENEDKAVFYLKKAHGINPEIFEIELLLGHLLFKQDHFDAAVKHLDAAIALNGESGTAFRVKGQILLERGDLAGAAAQFNFAVKFSPNDAAALSGYAQTMVRQGKNLKIALSFARKSLDLDPGNTLYQQRLEEITLALENTASQEPTIKSA